MFRSPTLTIAPCLVLLASVLASLGFSGAATSTRLAILGDRTGEAQIGIFENIANAVAADHPDAILGVGDMIEGLHDPSADGQWQEWQRTLQPLHGIPLYLSPGNHDVWSETSARLYEKYSRHPLHYSFDSGPLHVTVLDNSRTEDFSPQELIFLENDLKTHAAQALKIVVSHRPSWALHALTRDPDFPLHLLARKYGVRYVIAGHIHQMLHYGLEGVEYVSLPSSGGHLRDSGRYSDGWFFGYATLEVSGTAASFRIHELNGRTTNLEDWGPAGLR